MYHALNLENTGDRVDYGMDRQDQGERNDIQMDGDGWGRHLSECQQHTGHAHPDYLRYASGADKRYNHLLESGRGA